MAPMHRHEGHEATGMHHGGRSGMATHHGDHHHGPGMHGYHAAWGGSGSSLGALTSGPATLLGTLLKIALGAGVVLVGAYAISRQAELRTSSDLKTRLERLIAEVESKNRGG